MPDLENAFAQQSAIQSVSIIYGTALADSDGGEVRVQIGEPIAGVLFDDEDASEDIMVEMDDSTDRGIDEDYDAEQPYTSDDDGSDDDPPDVVAADETNIVDSENEASISDGDGVYPEFDQEDPLTEEYDEE